MTERWQRIEELFAGAAALGGEAREDYLDQQCANDEALRAEVEALLDAGGKAEDYLEDLARRAGLSPLCEDAAGLCLGSWRLLHLLGHGGMSTVYLAERADRQFEKRVAIKLVPTAMWGEEARRRFLQERQILARLEHPNIARLLDGGVSADGLPYLVMEYVEGRPLDRYCEEERLGLERRLELFLAVCGAVAYAHRNLVIHRDLKPANILVAEDGTAKLLDFGIAKLIGAPADAAVTVTRLGSRPLTPSYAAPELLRGEPVATTTDVYALGVLLYKLLSGRLPHDVADRSEAEAVRLICETIPPPPSRAALGPGATPACGLTAEKLSRRLAGDLDTIAMKALRTESERRYVSVEQLAEDVRRHLEHQPLRARPDTAAYRLSRFVRRHRIGVAATAALVVLALASGALIAGYAVRTARQRDAIVLERDKAQEVVKFLTGVFGNADPGTARGETITARQLLDRGAERIDTELADQPDLRATMLEQIGTIYYNLGLFRQAETLYEKAYSLRLKLYGESDANTETSLGDVAAARRKLGDYAGAERLYRHALAARQHAGGAEDAETATLLNNLAEVMTMTGNYAEAEREYRRSLALKRRLLPVNDASTASTLNDLALLKYNQGNFAASERLNREALAMRRNLFGNDHPKVAQSLNNLALDLQGEDKLSAAERMFRESLAAEQRLYHGDHESTAATFYNLALVLRGEGKMDEALATQRAAVAMGGRLWGESHPNMGIFYNLLGGILTDSGDYPGAREALDKSLAILSAKLPPNHYRIGDTHVGYGELDVAQGDYKNAEMELRQALAIYKEAFPSGHWKIGYAQSELGDCLRAGKRYSEAEPLLRAGYEMLNRLLGADDRKTRAALAHLATYYEAVGNVAKAAYYRRLANGAAG